MKCDVPQECQVLISPRRIATDRFVRHLFELVRGEVRRVRDRLEPGDERRIDLAYRVPVHAVEERMVLDLIDSKSAVRGGDQPGTRGVVEACREVVG